MASLGCGLLSFVFGLLCLFCQTSLVGIPLVTIGRVLQDLLYLGLLSAVFALIIGLRALDRSRLRPLAYGGKGPATAGVILGAVSLVWFLVLAGLLLPSLTKAREKARSISCIGNLKQIGLAARIYAADNQDAFPPFFQAMSAELSTPVILCCPADPVHTPVRTWEELTAANISYEWSGAGLKASEAQPGQIIVWCPVHGHVVQADGSVHMTRTQRRR